MKRTNNLLLIILVIILAIYYQQVNFSKINNDYFQFTVNNKLLKYDLKTIIIDKSDENNIALFSPYYNQFEKSWILYANDVYLYQVDNRINNVEYKNISQIDEYKDIKNDVFYANSSNGMGFDQFGQDLMGYGMEINVTENNQILNPLLYLLIVILLIMFILFLNVFEINRRRVEICVQKLFGKKIQRDKIWIRELGYLIIILVGVKIFMASTLLVNISFTQLILIALIIACIKLLIKHFEQRVYNSENILRLIKGENIKNPFLKYEYYIFIFTKLLSLVIVMISALLIYTSTELIQKNSQYSKLEDYYSLNGYLSKKDITKEEFVLAYDDEVENKSREDFTNFMSENYQAIYAFTVDMNSFTTGNNISNPVLVSNEEYLRINDNDNLIQNEQLDYVLVPQEEEGNIDEVEELLEKNPTFTDVKYNIYYYDEINSSVNLESLDPLTYQRPIIYINQNNYNMEVTKYAYQALYFQGGAKAVEDYYNEYGIKQEESIKVQSKYNMYITIMHLLKILVLFMLLILFIVLLIYNLILKLKVKTHFVEHAQELTIKRLNGVPYIYRNIICRYLLVDFCVFIISIAMIYVIYLFTTKLWLILVLLLIEFVNLFILDLILIKSNIGKIEKSNILNTIKGGV